MYQFFRKKIRRLLGLDELYALLIDARLHHKEMKRTMATATETLQTISDGLAVLSTNLDALGTDMQTAIADLKTQIGKDMPQLDKLSGIATAVSEMSAHVKTIDNAVKEADPSAFTEPAPAPAPTPAPTQATGALPADFPGLDVLAALTPPVATFEDVRSAGDLVSRGVDPTVAARVVTALNLADSATRQTPPAV